MSTNNNPFTKGFGDAETADERAKNMREAIDLYKKIAETKDSDTSESSQKPPQRVRAGDTTPDRSTVDIARELDSEQESDVWQGFREVMKSQGWNDKDVDDYIDRYEGMNGSLRDLRETIDEQNEVLDEVEQEMVSVPLDTIETLVDIGNLYMELLHDDEFPPDLYNKYYKRLMAAKDDYLSLDT